MPITDHEPERAPDPSSGFRPWRLVGIAAFTFLVIYLVAAASTLLLLVFGGIILGAYFSGLARLLERHTPLSYRWSITVVLLSHVVVLAAFAPWWMAQGQPQAERLVDELPKAFAKLGHDFEISSFGGWLFEHMPEPQALLMPGDDAMASGLRRFLSTFAGVFTGFAVLFLVGIYIAIHPDSYRRGLLRLVPIPRRARARTLLDALTHTLRMWVLGRIASAAIIGLGVSAGLWLLDIPLALMLGLLAAVLTFIPNFGPIASAIPPMLLALTRSPRDALYVLLLFVGVQIVESTTLTPIIEKRAVEVPPALLLSVQVILGLLTGIAGLALAAPLTAVAMVLTRHLYVEDVLGDNMDEPMDEGPTGEGVEKAHSVAEPHGAEGAPGVATRTV